MSESLIARYMYGRSPSLTALVGNTGAIDRENQILHLAEEQLKAQKTIASEIRGSAIEASYMIATEIDHQTRTFENTVNELATTISDSALDAAEMVSQAIDSLGDRFCAELGRVNTNHRVHEILREWRLPKRNIA